MNPHRSPPDLRSVARHFQLLGDFKQAEIYGNGHINDTYAVLVDQGGSPVRYILQRINRHVFKNPLRVLENIERVTTHLRHKLDTRGADQISRRILQLVTTRAGGKWYIDPEGEYWRCYLFVERATSHDRIETTQHAYEAARAFGEFQKLLADLPAPRLHETIPLFHHTRSRFDAFRAAIESDPCNRAGIVRSEIDFVLSCEPMVDVLLKLLAQGALPERVTHNDTKLNNVLIDDHTGEAICVIDLDTVMPGLVLYDFGDLCRTATCPTLEDERDLSKVEMRCDLFKALVEGYLSVAGEFLNRTEREHLAFSAKLITFEIGIRFLTDYLQGDQYFKIHRPGHNADRARVQFKMVESFLRQETAMEQMVAGAT
jgi:hypothetical protein